MPGAETSSEARFRAEVRRDADEDARRRAWASFGADSGWRAAKVASETGGPLLAKQTITVLDPAIAALPLG